MRDLLSWRAHPELAKLVTAIEASTSRKRFLSCCAEAMIARRLLTRGCALRSEVHTPSGRACDFEVTFGAARFYLHIKHVNTDRATERRLTVSSRFRYLERIARPYIVSVWWSENLGEEQLARYVAEASEFIKQARVGDELAIRDDADVEIGGCRVVAPGDGPNVNLTISLPSGFINETPRMVKAMRRAYRQFMPGETNVIVIGSSHLEDVEDFSSGLLGSHVERWDAFPRRGQRVAYGRGADGFWHEQRFAESRAAGWFRVAPLETEFTGKLWLRDPVDADSAVSSELAALFGDTH